MHDARIEAVADVLVRYSIELKPNQLVQIESKVDCPLLQGGAQIHARYHTAPLPCREAGPHHKSFRKVLFASAESRKTNILPQGCRTCQVPEEQACNRANSLIPKGISYHPFND